LAKNRLIDLAIDLLAVAGLVCIAAALATVSAALATGFVGLALLGIALAAGTVRARRNGGDRCPSLR
jgi:hypothetical protein